MLSLWATMVQALAGLRHRKAPHYSTLQTRILIITFCVFKQLFRYFVLFKWNFTQFQVKAKIVIKTKVSGRGQIWIRMKIKFWKKRPPDSRIHAQKWRMWFCNLFPESLECLCGFNRDISPCNRDCRIFPTMNTPNQNFRLYIEAWLLQVARNIAQRI